VRIARIFNTYGPRMHEDDGRVVSNFAVQALRGQPITIYGSGQQTRSFCHVDDLVEGAVRFMALDESTATDGGQGPHPMNLGNPVESTIRDIAELVRELTGSRSDLVFRPLPADDPTRRRPDIARAQRLLDWQPRISLRDGLARTIDDFRRRLTSAEP
jgi:UDP-glucuronate decarboxylase